MVVVVVVSVQALGVAPHVFPVPAMCADLCCLNFRHAVKGGMNEEEGKKKMLPSTHIEESSRAYSFQSGGAKAVGSHHRR